MTQPRTLGKYEILDVLGVGGMGTVYRALDPVLDRIVAVKLLRREYGITPGADGVELRFQTEARAVARLNHPTIVSVYDFSDTDPAGAFFVMEYVDGSTIDEYIRTAGQLDLAQALGLMSQLLDGLGYAHARDIVHRDIKPSNLIVTRDGQLKITDFGIAKVGSLKQTQHGMLIGTPEYMAPEQYTGGYIDPRCDLYAAGTLFFQLLTGRPPFVGSTSQIMYQICHVAAASVSTVNPVVPALFDPILANALAKDPEDRFQSAWHFAEAIAAVRKTLKIAAAPILRRPVASAVTLVRAAPEIPPTRPPVVPPVVPPLVKEPLPVAMPELATSLAVTAPSVSTPQAAPLAPPVPEHAVPDIAPRQTELIPIVRGWSNAPPNSFRDSVAAADAILAPRVDVEATPVRPVEPAVQPPVQPAAQQPPMQPRVAAPLDCTPDELTEIERKLTTILGPTARIVVKRAAALTRDRAQLYQELAHHLHSDEERQRFLGGLQSLGGIRPASAASIAPPPAAAPAVAVVEDGVQNRQTIPPATLERTTQILVRLMGPIAAMLVKKTAPTAADESDLYCRLAERIVDPEERKRFMAEVTGRLSRP